MADQGEDARSPSARAEEIARKRALQLKAADFRKRREAKIRVAIDAVLKTPAGRELWAYLFHLCGYNQSSIAVGPDGDVQDRATQHNEARRLVYIQLRKLASRSLLVPVEDAAESVGEELNQEEKH